MSKPEYDPELDPNNYPAFTSLLPIPGPGNDGEAKRENDAFIANVLQSGIVPLTRCQEISEGALHFCEGLARVGVSWGRNISIGVDETSTGYGERIVTIMFKAERHVDWYKSLGLLATVLAKNPAGNLPRKVDLKVEYYDLAEKFFLVTIVVHLFFKKTSTDGGRTIIEEGM